MNRRAFLAASAAAATAACGPRVAEAPDVFNGRLAEVTAELLAAQPEAGLAAGAPGTPRARLFDRRPAALDLQRAAALRRAAQWRSIDRAPLAPADERTFATVEAHLAAMAKGAAFGYGRFDPVAGFSPYALDHRRGAFVTLPATLRDALAGGDLGEASLHVQRLKLVAAAIDGETAAARADAQAGIVAPGAVLIRALDKAGAMLARAPGDTPYVAALRNRLTALNLLGEPAPNDSAERKLARKLLTDTESIVGAEILPAYRRAAALLADLRVRATDEASVARLPNGEAYYRAALAFHVGPALTADYLHQTGLARVKAITGQLDMMQRSQGLAEGDAGRRLAALTADPRFRYTDAASARESIINDVRRYQNRFAPALPRLVREPPPGPLDIAAKARLPVLHHLLPNSAFRFGWASYGEQLADEIGAYENDPYPRIGYLRSLALSAAHAVIDTGLHAKGWSAAQSAEYLTSAIGVDSQTAEDMVADCAATPGEGCAGEAGRGEIARLRDEARAALGPRFDVRDFHGAVLSHGEIPLAVLRDAVLAWVASVK